MSNLPKVRLIPELLVAIRIKDKWVLALSNGDDSVTFGDVTVKIEPGAVLLHCGMPRFMLSETGHLVGKSFNTQREVFEALIPLIKPGCPVKVNYNE